MQISTVDQGFLFLLFIAIGLIIGILFDIFRIIRKIVKMPDIAIYIQDALFCIISGFMTLYSIYIFNKGEIRAYQFVAIFMGISFYFLTFSRYFVIIGSTVGNLIKKFIILISNIILNVLRKIVFKPVVFISINLKNIPKVALSRLFHNIPKKCKKKKDLNNKCSII